jgi:hypothetical protein
MKTDPVVSPTMVVKRPVKVSSGDNAQAYSFKNHKAGAGHLNRRKSKMLGSEARPPKIEVKT